MPTVSELIRHRITQWIGTIGGIVALLGGLFALDGRYAKAETSGTVHVQLEQKIEQQEKEIVATLEDFRNKQQTQMDLNKLESYNNLIMQYELQQERDRENEKIRKNLEKLERRRDSLEMKIQERMAD